MLFSSPLFLTLFLPTLLIVYFITQPKYRNTVLLLSSLIFYSWGEPHALLIMLLLIIINWYAAIHISKPHIFSRRTILLATIIINISTLFFYKYLNFVISNVNTFTTLFNIPTINIPHISLPIGISFYCFQAISYTIDVYRNEVEAQSSLYKLALYISFFPQLIAGPIVRYSSICNDLNERSLQIDNIYEGIIRFSIGLAKKVFIADSMGYVADHIFVDEVSSIPQFWAWIGCLAYTLQIYYDFSAYSDMAIGLGRIFNFHFPENFNFPYRASSVKDFWRRWHISLSSWLRDYLYVPLGGNRISKRRTFFNQFIVFFLCGLWHGAAWNFIVWGIWHWAGLVSEKFTGQYLEKLPRIISHVYVISFVMIGWVLFRSPSLPYAAKYLQIMFLGNTNYDMFSFLPGWLYCITISNGIFMLAGVFFSWPISIISYQYLQTRSLGVVMLALFFIATYSFSMTSSFSPFLYFRF